jgi:hypothetical protein
VFSPEVKWNGLSRKRYGSFAQAVQMASWAVRPRLQPPGEVVAVQESREPMLDAMTSTGPVEAMAAPTGSWPPLTNDIRQAADPVALRNKPMTVAKRMCSCPRIGDHPATIEIVSRH